MPYDTPIPPEREAEYRAWKAKYAPRDSGEDYDLRGAFMDGLLPDPKTGHWSDKFKKPNHPTFSVESQYANRAPERAGSWDGETYTPPKPVRQPNDLDLEAEAIEIELELRRREQGAQPAPAPKPEPFDWDATIGSVMDATAPTDFSPESDARPTVSLVDPGRPYPYKPKSVLSHALDRVDEDIMELPGEVWKGVEPIVDRFDETIGRPFSRGFTRAVSVVSSAIDEFKDGGLDKTPLELLRDAYEEGIRRDQWGYENDPVHRFMGDHTLDVALGVEGLYSVGKGLYQGTKMGRAGAMRRAMKQYIKREKDALADPELMGSIENLTEARRAEKKAEEMIRLATGEQRIPSLTRSRQPLRTAPEYSPRAPTEVSPLPKQGIAPETMLPAELKPEVHLPTELQSTTGHQMNQRLRRRPGTYPPRDIPVTRGNIEQAARQATAAEAREAIVGPQPVTPNAYTPTYIPDDVAIARAAEGTFDAEGQVVIRVEIQREMADVAERPLKIGVRNPKNQGEFVEFANPLMEGTTETMRVRDAGNLDVAAHELGHAMERQYHSARGWASQKRLQRILKDAKKSGKSMSPAEARIQLHNEARQKMRADMGDEAWNQLLTLDPTDTGNVDEAMAVLTKRWLRGEEIPFDLVTYYERAFLKGMEHWRGGMASIRSKMIAWRTIGPDGRIAGVMDYSGRIAKALRPTIGARAGSRWRKFRRAWEDGWFPVRHMEAEIMRGGTDLSITERASEAAYRVNRGAPARAHSWMYDGITDRSGDVIAPSMEENLKLVSDDTEIGLNYWLARYTQDLNGPILEHRVAQWASRETAMRTERLANKAAQKVMPRREAVKTLKEKGISKPTKQDILDFQRSTLTPEEMGAIKQQARPSSKEFDNITEKFRVDTGVSLDDANAFVDTHRTAAREKFTEEMTKTTRAATHYLVEGGVIDEAQFERIVRMVMDDGDALGSVYMPLKRIMVDENFGFLGNMEGMGGSRWFDIGNPVKGLKGSGRPIMDPREALQLYWQQIISASDRNWVGRKIVQAVEKSEKGGKFLERLGTITRRVPRGGERYNRLRADIQGHFDDIDPEDLDALMNIMEGGRPTSKADNLVSWWENGELVSYDIHPELYHALQDLGPQALTGFLETAIRKPAELQRLGAVVLNPRFQMMWNPMRDIWSAFLYTKGRALGPIATPKFMYDIAKGFYRTMSMSKESKEFRRIYRLHNVGMAERLGQNQKSWREAAKMATMTRAQRIRYNIIRHPLQSIGEMMSVAERAVRMAEMERVGAMYGWKIGQPLSEKVATAMTNAARDITVNFNRAGEVGRVYNRWEAFFNARVQGPTKFFRHLRDPETRMPLIARGLAGITAPATASWLYWHDKEEWKRAPAWLKYGFLWLKLPWSDEPFRVPVPWELWSVFGGSWLGALDTVEGAIKGDEDAHKHMLDSLGQTAKTFSPADSPIPTTFGKVMAETSMNYDSFRGRPVDNWMMQRKKMQDRVTDNTTETAKFLGRMSDKMSSMPEGEGGLSPNRINHFLDSMLGGFVGRAEDAVGFGMSVAERVEQYMSGETPQMDREPDPSEHWLYGSFHIKPEWYYGPAFQNLYIERNRATMKDSGVSPARKRRLNSAWKKVNELRDKAEAAKTYSEKIKFLAEAAQRADEAVRR